MALALEVPRDQENASGKPRFAGRESLTIHPIRQNYRHKVLYRFSS